LASHGNLQIDLAAMLPGGKLPLQKQCKMQKILKSNFLWLKHLMIFYFIHYIRSGQQGRKFKTLFVHASLAAVAAVAKRVKSVHQN
jgi:hypothetical protein